MSDSIVNAPARRYEDRSALFAVGACFFAVNIVVQMHGNVVPLSLQRVFGLSEMLIGAITGAVNLLVSLLLLLSNRSRPRLSAVAAMLALAGGSVMLLRRAESSRALIPFVACFFLGTVLVNAAKVSATKTVVVGNDPKRKSGAMAVVKTLEVLGGFACLLIIYFLSGTAMYACISAVVLILSAFALLRGRRIEGAGAAPGLERRRAGVLGLLKAHPGKAITLLAVWCWYIGYDAMTTTFSRYAVNAWHMQGNSYTICLLVCMVSATVFYIPAGKLFRSRPARGIAVGLLLIAAGLLMTSLSRSYRPILNALFVMIGVGWSCVAVNGVILTASDVDDECAGRLVSLYYVASSLSKILAPVISGAILEYLPYRSLYAILSLFFLSAIGFLAFGQRLRYRQ